jgi:hypothetical protein
LGLLDMGFSSSLRAPLEAPGGAERRSDASHKQAHIFIWNKYQ